MTNLYGFSAQQSKWAIRFVLTAALIVGLSGCGSDQPDSAPLSGKDANAESFTFFDLGTNSLFSDATRISLNDKLGNDAISHRNMINLEVNYPGFLKQYFTDLDHFNRRLNSDIGERIDHETIKLTYRYARKRDVPFDYVEIIFSDYSKKPVLLKIRFKADTLGTIDRLVKKYGTPGEIIWGQDDGRTLFWEKNQDYLLASLVPNQFGVIEHRIAIFFTANLEDLLQKEQAKKLGGREEKAKSGKSAF